MRFRGFLNVCNASLGKSGIHQPAAIKGEDAVNAVDWDSAVVSNDGNVAGISYPFGNTG